MKGNFMRGLNLLFSDAKDFFANEMNRVFIAVILIGLVSYYMIYTLNLSIIKLNSNMEEYNTNLLKAIDETENKVDFRYFNTTKTLEEIHNVKVNTKTGELKN
ncbi:MAG: hypothetical protein ACLSWI_01630 [Candidatus Gastranaerophilaceae bacterium]